MTAIRLNSILACRRDNEMVLRSTTPFTLKLLAAPPTSAFKAAQSELRDKKNRNETL